ncbi:flippase Wzx [Actinobacillus pleuropneumoniae]|nr:flippase Wzx [Actinobacillus pleuropneumoniae]KIE89610.1 flippase Wzx [Actinobacillus pleuropneumoniae]KIE94907.1 flippase Wzx [Actinobacillus pleuropneumoniae]KIE96075.1 flippase Wzx [Actinobacillus pleuropneumoniae]KIE96234.1 flippase Wzx [Actinobacillus pleuropneumoniae]
MLSAITNILGIQILLPLKKDKELLISVLLAAIVDIVANLILVPQLASVGTAISVVMAELTVLVVQLVILRKYIWILFSNLQFVRIGLSIVFSIVLSLSIYQWNITNSIMLTFLIMGFIFFTTYFILLLILKENFMMYVYQTIQHKILK